MGCRIEIGSSVRVVGWLVKRGRGSWEVRVDPIDCSLDSTRSHFPARGEGRFVDFPARGEGRHMLMLGKPTVSPLPRPRGRALLKGGGSVSFQGLSISNWWPMT